MVRYYRELVAALHLPKEQRASAIYFVTQKRNKNMNKKLVEKIVRSVLEGKKFSEAAVSEGVGDWLKTAADYWGSKLGSKGAELWKSQVGKSVDYGMSEPDRIAQARNTSVSALETLSNDENRSVRAYVASNPHTPALVLKKLSKDESWSVRSYVAEHPNTPVSSLKKL